MTFLTALTLLDGLGTGAESLSDSLGESTLDTPFFFLARGSRSSFLSSASRSWATVEASEEVKCASLGALFEEGWRTGCGALACDAVPGIAASPQEIARLTPLTTFEKTLETQATVMSRALSRTLLTMAPSIVAAAEAAIPPCGGC